jgi:hypothetical protein
VFKPAKPKPVYREAIYPPDGFSLTLPNGNFVRADCLANLIVATSTVSGMSPEAASDFVHAKLCARAPNNCSDAGPSLPNGGFSIGTLASLHMAKLHQAPAATIKRVPEADVAGRRKACQFCPRNAGLDVPGCCSGKSSLAALTKGVAAKYGISGAFAYGWCGVLGTPAAILAQLDFLTISPDDAVYALLPDNCPAKSIDNRKQLDSLPE